jgi:hypothetical protein
MNNEDLSKIDVIIGVNEEGYIQSYVNGLPKGLQNITSLEYGRSYLFISNTVPYDLCTETVITTTTTTTTTAVASAWTPTVFPEENISSVDLSSEGNVIVVADDTWDNNSGRFKTLFWIDSAWNSISVEGVQATKAVINHDSSILVLEDINNVIKTYVWTGEWYPDSIDITLSNVYDILDIAIDQTGNAMAALVRNSSTSNIDVYVYLRNTTNDGWTQIYQQSYSTLGNLNDNLAGVDIHYTNEEDIRLAVGISENNTVYYTSIDHTNTNYVLNFELLGVNTFGGNVKIVDNDTLLATDAGNIYLFDFTTTSNNYAANSNPATAFTSHTASLEMGDSTSGDFDAQSVGTKICHIDGGSLIVSNRDSSTTITQEDIVEAFEVSGSTPNRHALAISDNKNVIALIENIASSNTNRLNLYQKTPQTIPNVDKWFALGDTLTENTSYDELGTSVAINSAGNLVAVGAKQSSGTGSGYVNVYGWSGSAWEQIGTSLTGDVNSSLFGNSVSVSHNGQFLVVGDTGSASAYVYSWNGSDFALTFKVSSSEPLGGFGYSVAIADNGTVIVGAPNESGSGGEANAGKIYIYDASGSLSHTYSKNETNAYLGADVDINGIGGIVAVGMPSDTNTNPGKVEVLQITESQITRIGGSILSGSGNNDLFGITLSLDHTGNRVAIASLQGKYVRIYESNINGWTIVCDQIDSSIDASIQDGLGDSIALSSNGSAVFIGSISQNKHGIASGSIKSYSISSTSPTKLYPEIIGNESNEHFGFSINVSENGNIIVGGSPDAGNQNAGTARVLAFNRAVPSPHSLYQDSNEVQIETFSATSNLIFDETIASFYSIDNNDVLSLSGDGKIITAKTQLSSNQDGTNITDNGISVFNIEQNEALGFISLNGIHEYNHKNVLDINGVGDRLVSLVTLDGQRYTAKVFEDDDQDRTWEQLGEDIALPITPYVAAKINVDGTRIFILTDESNATIVTTTTSTSTTPWPPNCTTLEPCPANEFRTITGTVSGGTFNGCPTYSDCATTTTTTTTQNVSAMTLMMLELNGTTWDIKDTITLASDTLGNDFDPEDTDQIIWPNMLDIDDLGELVIIGNRNSGPLVYRWNGTNLVDITSNNLQIPQSARNNVNVSISGDGQTIAFGPTGNTAGAEYGANGSIKIIAYDKSSGLFSDIGTRYGELLNQKFGHYGMKLNYWGDRLFANNIVLNINEDKVTFIGAVYSPTDIPLVINVSNMGHRIVVHGNDITPQYGKDERFTVFNDTLSVFGHIAFWAYMSQASIKKQYTDMNIQDVEWYKVSLNGVPLDPEELISTGPYFHPAQFTLYDSFLNERRLSSILGLYTESNPFTFYDYQPWIDDPPQELGQWEHITINFPFNCYQYVELDVSSSTNIGGVAIAETQYCGSSYRPNYVMEGGIVARYNTINRDQNGNVIPYFDKDTDVSNWGWDTSCVGSFDAEVSGGVWVVTDNYCENGATIPSDLAAQLGESGEANEGNQASGYCEESEAMKEYFLNTLDNIDVHVIPLIGDRNNSALHYASVSVHNVSDTDSLVVGYSEVYAENLAAIYPQFPYGSTYKTVEIPPRSYVNILATAQKRQSSLASSLEKLRILNNAGNYSTLELACLTGQEYCDVCGSASPMKTRGEYLAILEEQVRGELGDYECNGLVDGEVVLFNEAQELTHVANVIISGAGQPVVSAHLVSNYLSSLGGIIPPPIDAEVTTYPIPSWFRLGAGCVIPTADDTNLGGTSTSNTTKNYPTLETTYQISEVSTDNPLTTISLSNN